MPVPDYLGRILTDDGTPIGTCFQVSPAVLVTAWHVLDDLGRGAEDAVVAVDALDGAAEVMRARVLKVDPLHDLAVLESERPLPGSVAGWFATDWVPINESTVVTGVTEVVDPGHEVPYLDAPGTWAGGTMRDRQVPLGRLRSQDVLPGMSGAPVRRLCDQHVIGVVSARYNSADGWLAHTVWVVRSEDVQNLLAGIEDVPLEGAPDLGEAVDLILSVTDTEVRLTGPFQEVTAAHGGVSPGLATAMDDVRRARARAGVLRRSVISGEQTETGSVSLRRAGELLAESFLPEPVADTLVKVLRRATEKHVPVRIGVQAPDWPGLPWEALPDPATSRPLALCPLVTVYRKVTAPAVRSIPGPLRILVAISAPVTGGGAVLDYERELRNVIAAVRGARAGDADVRVVPFATTSAIRAALDEAPAHVLHVSCHGGPGTLDLEDDRGAARAVTAAELVEEAIPPGQMPPVVCLSACYTDAPSEAGAPSLAAGLVEHGASVVVGTETSVTDWYATALFARVYQELAQSAAVPDVVAAVADARRIVQLQLASSTHPRESQLAGLDEWSVVTVLAATGATKVFDPAVVEPVPHRDRGSVAGLLQRGYGEFVGRRREQRTLPVALAGREVSGVVLHGIGGVGKTTLAAELVRHLGFPAVAVCRGELSVDDVFTEVTGALRRHLALRGGQEQLLRAVDYAGRRDERWQDRFVVLREQVLSQVPVLVVLDNFEDNLTDRAIRDETLAGVLAAWAGEPGESRLLITSRYPFALPEDADRSLRFELVGPMSMAETFKLIWSLPALDRLDDDDVVKVWRLVGGHPRSLEYLDALLNGGHARFPDITRRLTAAINARPEGQRALTADTLDAALAETLTLIADDVLIDELLESLDGFPGARDLLIGASVYREPVDLNALLFQIGEVDESKAYLPDYQAAEERIMVVLREHNVSEEELDLARLPAELIAQIQPDLEELGALPRPPRAAAFDVLALVMELAATSLLTVDADESKVFVHRWTASELDRRMRREGGAEQLQEAHSRAADYWLWRVAVWPQDLDRDLHDNLEDRHHLIAANRLDHAEKLSRDIVDRLWVIGAWDQASMLSHESLDQLAHNVRQEAHWQHQLGMFAQHRGDYTEAEHRYTASLTISEELGNRAGIAATYHQLGMLAHDRGDYTEAERQYTASLTINEELGNRATIAATYHELGNIAYLRNDFAEAERQYTASLTINEELGNRASIATTYHQLGMLAHDRGDYTEAERQYTASLTIEEELGDRAGMATSYHQLGMLAHARSDYTEAKHRYIASLTIEEELGNRAGIATSFCQLGVLADDTDDLRGAVELHCRAFALRREVGVPMDFDVQRLGSLRERLAPEQFAAWASQVLSPAELSELIALLDDDDSSE